MSNGSDTFRIRTIVEEGMIISVGNGNSVLFWHDRWCEIGILKRIFPRLYAISLQKNLLVSQMGEWNEIAWVWNLEWRRALYVWENEEVSRLKHIIEQNGPSSEGEDGVYWKHSGNLCYPIKCITKRINESYTPTLSRPIINIVWKKFIPPRAKLALWLENLERLKTGDLLVEKGIINPQDAACPFCNLEIESNSHILFTCRFAWNVWMEMLGWWGISAVLHNRCNTFSIQWLGLVKKRNCRHFWALILGCGIWSLWYERNRIKFERKSPNLQHFVLSLKFRIGIWAKELLGYTGLAPQNVIYNIDSIVLQV